MRVSVARWSALAEAMGAGEIRRVGIVANPRLFAPECRSPRQMKLANALCRYRELGRPVERIG